MASMDGRPGVSSQAEAQRSADRIRLLREELATPELRQVLDLSPEQQQRFDEWSHQRLAQLAQAFDVDTSASQRRVSWGMRIASTLGGLAICLAVVLFFMRYWGNIGTVLQVSILIAVPLLALAGAEYASTRERTLYFTGLLALVSFTSFVLNLGVLGQIFNIIATERALLAWSVFALLLAYRYGLRLLLATGLLLFLFYVAAAVSTWRAHLWSNFGERPELIVLLAFVMFWAPQRIYHRRHTSFPAVYRLVGAIAFFLCILALSEWGVSSYLPLPVNVIGHIYSISGLALSGWLIWVGIKRSWSGTVNVAAAAFAVFLFARLFHWWWHWMPKYLFFAVIGALGIALMIVFKRVRTRLAAQGVQA